MITEYNGYTFKYHYKFKKINKINSKDLIDSKIIKAPPQSTQRIDEDNYKKLKKLMGE